MQSQTLERVTEEEKIVAHSIEKWLDTEMIACAEELSLPRIPNDECEIAPQTMHALLSPRRVGMEKQFGGGRRCVAFESGALKFFAQFGPAIEPRIRDDP